MTDENFRIWLLVIGYVLGLYGWVVVTSRQIRDKCQPHEDRFEVLCGTIKAAPLWPLFVPMALLSFLLTRTVLK